jgi:hypothetical protein
MSCGIQPANIRMIHRRNCAPSSSRLFSPRHATIQNLLDWSNHIRIRMKFRPRFTLRTLFIAIALIAAACGWTISQKRLVDRRNAWYEWAMQSTGTRSIEVQPRPLWEFPIPFIRNKMGDSFYPEIVMRRASDDQLEKIRALFPEAKVRLQEPVDGGY